MYGFVSAVSRAEVTFTASTTLDVVEYLDGLPAEMEAEHLTEAVTTARGAQPRVLEFNPVFFRKYSACIE